MRNALFYMFLTHQNTLFYMFRGIQNTFFYIFQYLQHYAGCRIWSRNMSISKRNHYRHFWRIFRLQSFLHIYSRTKKFFSRKSIKVSLFRGNNILNVWYIATYKNETFDIFYRKVSQKYHKIGRSIIKYGYESIKKAKKEVYTIPVL